MEEDKLVNLAVRILQSMQKGKEYVVKWEQNEKGEMTAKVEALEK